MTNRRIFAQPTNPDEAWRAVDALIRWIFESAVLIAQRVGPPSASNGFQLQRCTMSFSG